MTGTRPADSPCASLILFTCSDCVYFFTSIRFFSAPVVSELVLHIQLKQFCRMKYNLPGMHGLFFFKKYLPLITWLLFQDLHVFDQKWDSLANFWEAEAKRCPALLCSTAAAAAWSLDSLKALSDNMWHCYEDVLNVKPRVLYRNWEMWLTQWRTKHCFAFMSGQLREHELQKFRAAGAARSHGQKGEYIYYILYHNSHE